MFRDLITLPLRVAASSTRVGMHVAVDALAVGVTIAYRLVELTVPRPKQVATSGSVWSVEVVSIPVQSPPAEPAADEQAAPVESFADAAAQNGAEESVADADAQDGAEESVADAQDAAASSVHVEEPWKGYGGMNAHDVIHRLTVASTEEAAAAELYERSHGTRKTVLAAAERRLRQPAGAGSPS
ncbi:MAG TPA: hypothetical protein VFY32_06750 [Solirubrobacteraceae bacterium]|nr:hypothetical protein [Solirubrobacteraceae bacterium]